MPHIPHVHKAKEHKPKKHSHSSKEKRDHGKKSILFQSVGGMSNASTRLICYENAKYLRNFGWKIKIGKAKLGEYDIIIFQKRYNSRDLDRARKARGKIVLQISEARFIRSGPQSAIVIKFAHQANGVVVGTNYLRGWFKKKGIASTVIPTGLDFANLPHGVVKKKPIKICWIGSARNERYLSHLVKPLNRLWNDGYNFEFRVIGAKMFQANWAKHPNFIGWELGKAERYVAECHIGVAPLDQGGIEMTKPPSKPVMYMALRLAVVASSTPPYQELIRNGSNGYLISNNSPEEWYNALKELFSDSKRQTVANLGHLACQPYNAPNIAKRWNEFLRGL